MSTIGFFFQWRCGTCPKILSAPDLEELWAAVRNHIRESRQRGATEPRCGNCGQPIDETQASLERHTTFSDDSPTVENEQPVCRITRLLEGLVVPKHTT